MLAPNQLRTAFQELRAAFGTDWQQAPPVSALHQVLAVTSGEKVVLADTRAETHSPSLSSGSYFVATGRVAIAGSWANASIHDLRGGREGESYSLRTVGRSALEALEIPADDGSPWSADDFDPMPTPWNRGAHVVLVYRHLGRIELPMGRVDSAAFEAGLATLVADLN